MIFVVALSSLTVTASSFLRLGGMISAYKIVPDEMDEIKVGDIHVLHLQHLH